MARFGYRATSRYSSRRQITSVEWRTYRRGRFKVLYLECGHVIDTGNKRGEVGDVKRCLRCEERG